MSRKQPADVSECKFRQEHILPPPYLSPKLAEATAAAEALEKAKKALEEDLAKHAPDPDNMKKSVHFEDVLGRKYDVPWRFAKTWKGMKSLIEQAFNHVDVVGRPIMEGRYDLIGPNGMIILPQVWDIVIQPEWVIKMELWPTPEPDPAPPSDRDHVSESSNQSHKKVLDNPGNVALATMGRFKYAKKGLRVHKCEHCGKTYTRIEHLKRHKYTHLPRQYPCTVLGCPSSFHRKHNLQSHLSQHAKQHLPKEVTPPPSWPVADSAANGAFCQSLTPHTMIQHNEGHPKLDALVMRKTETDQRKQDALAESVDLPFHCENLEAKLITQVGPVVSTSQILECGNGVKTSYGRGSLPIFEIQTPTGHSLSSESPASSSESDVELDNHIDPLMLQRLVDMSIHELEERESIYECDIQESRPVSRGAFRYQMVHNTEQCHDGGEGSEQARGRGNKAVTGISSLKRSQDRSKRSISPSGSGRGNKCRKVMLKPGSGTSRRRFACPYNKYKPFVYMTNDQTGKLYEFCDGRYFENMSKTYEHVKRRHYENPNQCPLCGICFVGDPEEFCEHIRSEVRCQRVDHVQILYTSPRVIESIKLDLRNRGLDRSDDEVKWIFLYKGLFNQDPSGSPYGEDERVAITSRIEDHLAQEIRMLRDSRPSNLSLDFDELESLVPQFIQNFRRQQDMPFANTESRGRDVTSTALADRPTASPRLRADSAAQIVTPESSTQSASSDAAANSLGEDTWETLMIDTNTTFDANNPCPLSEYDLPYPSDWTAPDWLSESIIDVENN